MLKIGDTPKHCETRSDWGEDGEEAEWAERTQIAEFLTEHVLQKLTPAYWKLDGGSAPDPVETEKGRLADGECRPVTTKKGAEDAQRLAARRRQIPGTAQTLR